MHEGDEEAGLLIGKIYWVPSERTEADYWPCMVVEERCKFLLPERHRPARKSDDDVLVRHFLSGELTYEDAKTRLLNFVKSNGWKLLLEKKDGRIRKACECAYYFLDQKSNLRAFEHRLKVRDLMKERKRLEKRMKEIEEELRKIKKAKEKKADDPETDSNPTPIQSPVVGENHEQEEKYTSPSKIIEKEEGKVMWVKKSGFPWWPSIVLNEEKELKFVGTNVPKRKNKNQLLVRFFADGYHEFIANKPAHIRPFNPEAATPPQGTRKIRKDVQEAIEAAKEWLENTNYYYDDSPDESEGRVPNNDDNELNNFIST